MNSIKETGTSNVVDYILKNIRGYNDNNIAQVDSKDNTELTYKDLVTKINNFANYLRKSGIKQGDVICICSRNTIEFVWCLLGALYAGATCALLGSSIKKREMDHAFNMFKPKWVISSELNNEQLDVILNHREIKKILVSCNDLSDDSMQNDLYCPQIICPSKGNDVALILMSSGSTGLPKGVLLTHNNLIFALQSSSHLFNTNAKALGLMPFSHAYGLILMLLALCEGSLFVIMDRFNLQNFLDIIQNYKLTHLHIVPSLLSTISKIDQENKIKLHSVKCIWTGAGMINPKHQEKILNLIDNVELNHSYGMTETTFIAMSGQYNIDKPGSPGKLLPIFKCKIVSELNNEICGIGEVGELFFQGPTIMKGYLNNEAATQESIIDGWLRSGDLGFVDEDGYYYIIERIKEIIKYQGYQISPSEIESVILLHKGVVDVAVIGRPHDIYGEVPQAFVVTKDKFKITENEIQDLVRKELSAYKQLKGGVKFIPSIPKTTNGKICRKELKRLHCDNS